MSYASSSSQFSFFGAHHNTSITHVSRVATSTASTSTSGNVVTYNEMKMISKSAKPKRLMGLLIHV